MKNFIENLNTLKSDEWEILACCCGHGKYPMTIVAQHKKFKAPFELFSNINIHTKRKFYKRDKEGFYYIPEVMEKLNRKEGELKC